MGHTVWSSGRFGIGMGVLTRSALIGGGLIAGYTLLIAAADAVTRVIGGSFAAPQLFALSGVLVAALAALTAWVRPDLGGLRTAQPGLMTARTVATILAALGFFQAFRMLPFAEVFLFIGLMPLMAALLAGPLLGDAVRPRAWGVLIATSLGVLLLRDDGPLSFRAADLVGLGAAGLGTLSMLLARRMCQTEPRLLAQVFWPNLGLGVVMALALPLYWQPMAAVDLGLVGVYGLLLFGARWLTVAALRLIPAHVVTPLMNLQFVWMVGLGAWVWGEVPDPQVYLGAALVVTGGGVLVWDSAQTEGLRA